MTTWVGSYTIADTDIRDGQVEVIAPTAVEAMRLAARKVLAQRDASQVYEVSISLSREG